MSSIKLTCIPFDSKVTWKKKKVLPNKLKKCIKKYVLKLSLNPVYYCILKKVTKEIIYKQSGTIFAECINA